MNTKNGAVQRFIGSRANHLENGYVTVAMLLVTVLYELFSKAVFPDFTFNVYEFVGTWSGLVTVWLCRTQNVLCWPWGILSALAFGFFFGSIGLPGQQWLNWGYFLIIQLWAWPNWAFGGEAKTELPITFLGGRGRLFTLASITIGTVLVYMLIDTFVPGSQYPILDATVVASSVVAQLLLGRKNVESWYLWFGPVNLLSIILFYLSGAYTVMALYIAFFIHAACAIRKWRRDVQLVA